MDPYLKAILDSNELGRPEPRPQASDPLLAPGRFAAATPGQAEGNVYRTALEGFEPESKSYADRAMSALRRLGLEEGADLFARGKTTDTPWDYIPAVGAAAKGASLAGKAAFPGILMGWNAKGAPIESMRAAIEELQRYGMPDRMRRANMTIPEHYKLWQDYHIGVGKEGKLRWEAPDDMGLTALGQRVIQEPIGKAQTYDLGELLDFSNLYRAYPNSPNIKTKLGYIPVGLKGVADYPWKSQPQGAITMAAANEEDLLAGLIHELQHGVQYREGFASGANTNAMIRAAKEGRRASSPAQDRELADQISSWDRGYEPGMRDYYAAGGEVEARNVTDRFLSPDLKNFPPVETESIKRRLQNIPDTYNWDIENKWGLR